MEKNTIPERPSKVTLAIYILYASLGIGIIMALVKWLLSGTPGSVGYFLITFLMSWSSFHFRTPTWIIHGDLAFVPIALWLFWMTGKGKNWARIALLTFVILESLLLIATSAIALYLSASTASLLSLPELLMYNSPMILQHILQIAAVTLLFGRVPSNWFKAVKLSGQHRRNKASRIAIIAVGPLALMIAIAFFLQLTPWSQNGALIEATRQNRVTQVQELLRSKDRGQSHSFDGRFLERSFRHFKGSFGQVS